MKPPFEDAYWVETGRLMAGAYPGEYQDAVSERRLRGLLQCGIRTFVTLMQAREESPNLRAEPAYARALERVARHQGVRADCHRFDIHDMSVPSHAQMDAIQAAIDASLADERPVYVHCWRGRGRTGTVVGAYLIRRGLATPENFVEVIHDLREAAAGLFPGPSPETGAQVDFVRAWARRGSPG